MSGIGRLSEDHPNAQAEFDRASENDPTAELSPQRALPRGDAAVAFRRKVRNQGLLFRNLDISFDFAKPRN
jgi:hypothetical protein